MLLVEDNQPFAQLVGRMLGCSDDAEYAVEHAESVSQAKAMVRERDFDVVLLDLALPDSLGLETLEAIHTAVPRVPIVVFTATDDEVLGHEAVRLGAQDYLIKGQADDRLLVRAIDYAIERRRIVEERDDLIEQLRIALDEVKQLSGLLPICAFCKKVRDDQGYWNQIELYIRERSEAEFSHCFCPDCIAKHFPAYQRVSAEGG